MRARKYSLMLISGMILGLAVLLPVGSMIIQKHREAAAKAVEIHALQQDVASLEARRDTVQSQIRYLKTREGLEEEARRQGMVKKGERSFVISETNQNTNAESATPPPRRHPIDQKQGTLDRIRAWWKAFVGPSGP